MDSKDKRLFTEFPPVPTEEWMKVITEELKGADFDKKLVWKSLDKFNLLPFYREEDLNGLQYLESAPGAFPYTRGGNPCNDWEIRQSVVIQDVAEANRKAVEAVAWGAQGITFIFSDEIDRNCAKSLLQGIDLKSVAVHFNVGKDVETFAASLLQYLKDNRIEPEMLKGSLDYDPLRYYATRGTFYGTAEESFNSAKTLIEQFAAYPSFRVIGANGMIFKNAGASITQEVAFALAAGVEYLHRLTDKGLKTGDIAKKMAFNFGITASYFPEIAKFRAARMLWANIVKAYPDGCDACARMKLHAETSFWNMTIYDPYVNMLRTTTEAMSAALGGADAITVKPFDAAFRASSDFSERISRNQQIILKEEAHFNKVADAAAGSYFIENLTNAIAESAWNIFLEIEAAGGYVQALQKGIIQTMVSEMQKTRLQNVSTRKETVLGTNQFPNSLEKAESTVCECAKQIWDMTVEGAEIETIKPFRMAFEFETLRLQTDDFSKNHKRPTVFMLTIGNLTMRKARAQFATNFFACAGYEIVDNNGFNTIEEGLNAAAEKKADIVVLCSSDEEYATLAPEAFDKIAGKTILVIAGNPVDCLEALKAKGIEHFIHARSNILETLKRFNELLLC